MSTVVDIPGHGEVEFPDSMSDADIASAAKRLHEQSNPGLMDTVGRKALATGIGATSILEPLNPVAAGINTVLRKTLGGHLGVPEAQGGLGQTWQEEMQRFREGKRWAQKESPVGYTAGALAGGLGAGGAIPMMASKAAAATPGLVGAGQRALGATLDSALFTGASAAGSNLDTDPLGAASQAAKSPANLIAAAPGAVGDLGPRLRQAMETKAANMGRRVLLGGYTPISVRKAIPEEVVQTASEAGAFLPLGTTKGAFKRLEGRASDVGDTYGDLVRSLERAGVDGPSAKSISAAARQEARDSFNNTSGSPRPGMFNDFANDIMMKLTKGNKLGGNLGLEQAENIKRSLQDAAKEEYIKLNQNVGARGLAEKDKASMMRQAVEDAISAQSSKAPDLASQFVPVKQELANLIQARNAAEVGTSRQAHRRALTPYDMAALVGGLAHGSLPLGVGTAAGVHIMGSRLPSTGTWALYKAAKGLPANAMPPPSGVTEEMIALANAIRARGALPQGAGLRFQSAVPDEEK